MTQVKQIGSLAFMLVWGCSVEYVTLADGAGIADGATGDTTDGSGDLHATDGGDLQTTDGGTTEGDTNDDGGVSQSGDSHPGDSLWFPGDVLCPPCAPPPADDCVGSGPCGCGPYQCPGDPPANRGDEDVMCGGNTFGKCPLSTSLGVSCQCCPAAGPYQNCLCTTACVDDNGCTNPLLPMCNKPADDISSGMCTNAEFLCCWECQ